MIGLFKRVRERERPSVAIEIDGVTVEARAGDTVMTAILTHRARLRVSEFGDGARAGFCLMGACQDCWVWTREGGRLRACSTPIRPGLAIVTGAAPWPNPV